MPLIALAALAGLGGGFILGAKTSDLVKTVIIGGVVYFIVKKVN